MARNIGLSWVVGLIIAAAFPVILAWAGYFVKWGAHPWWDVKTALIGTAVGLVGAVAIARLSGAARLIVGFAILGSAIGISTYGKTQFAASFAEDAMAGRMWFFGWIGIAAGLTLMLSESRQIAARFL